MNLRKCIVIVILLGVCLGAGTLSAAAPENQLTLKNSAITAAFNARGLVSVYDTALNQTIEFADESGSLTVDGEKIDLSSLSAPEVKQAENSITYAYTAGKRSLKAVYELGPGWRFVTKQLILSCDAGDAYRVNTVEVMRAGLTNPVASERQLRWSRGAFLRFSESGKSGYGMFFIVQNPFLSWKRDGQSFSTSYEPDMDWKSDYGPFESDRACIGPYKLIGVNVPLSPAREWEYRPDPTREDGDSLDIAEIEAVQECVRPFIMFETKRSIRIDVGWCANDYQIDVSTPEGVTEYRRIIDRAAEMGCTHLLYAPQNSAVSSRAENTDAWGWESLLWLSLGQKIRKGEWDPAKDAVPQSIQDMLDYARSKNIKLVAYAYPTLGYKQDPEWTKWCDGRTGSYTGVDTGVRSFQDWFVDKLATYQKKTGLGGYAFDHWWIGYGPPATSKYAQWYGCRRILCELRRRCPDIVIDGRQQYQWSGVWTWVGGTYPHPTSTDEQPGSFRAFSDLHTDRVSADRQRYTAWMYRMRDCAPTELTPGYITHQTQRSDAKGTMRWDTFRARDWDYLGWKYSLISSIGTAPFNHVLNMLPARDKAEFDAFSEADKRWCRKWLDWTDEHMEYLRRLRPIIGCPMVGRVDGTAGIVEDRGYIFLFNPNYRRLTAEFTLDETIGLTRGDRVVIMELYPREARLIGKPGSGFWKLGDGVSIPMEGASALVLAVTPAKPVTTPLVFNLPGKASVEGKKLVVTGVSGEIGTEAELVVALSAGQEVTSVVVNGVKVRFARSGDVVTAGVKFPGTRFSQCQQVASYNPAFTGGVLRGRFTIPKRIFKQLQDRKKAWPIPYNQDDLVATWLGPDRLLLFINIADPRANTQVSMKIDGAPVEVKPAYNGIYPNSGRRTFLGSYADVSSLKPDKAYEVEVTLPDLEAGRFQGLFLDNVETEFTGEAVEAPRRPFDASAAAPTSAPSGSGAASESAAPVPQGLQSPTFNLKVEGGGITSLKRVDDAFDTEYIASGRRLGDIFIRYRKQGGAWIEADTATLGEAGARKTAFEDGGKRCDVTYPVGEGPTPELFIRMHFTVEGEAINWTMDLENNTDQPIEVGDLSIPLPTSSVRSWDREETATKGIARHGFVSGSGSFIFWMRCNSVGPYLMMTPLDDTKLEYFNSSWGGGRWGYHVYIHSAAEGATAKEKGCKWRQPNTSLTLAAKGDSKTYGFKFQWARDYEAVRQVLVNEGKIDVQVVPGMTVPVDLAARFALRTKQKIGSVEPEFPQATKITDLGKKGDDTELYEVKFSKLGENLITVNYGPNHRMYLEFFVTEPVETLLKKRAAFLVKHQHRDPSKWYNGLISEWNNQTHVRLGPDNYDLIQGRNIYAVSCDDPALGRAPLVASKNVEYPDQQEVEAVDYYIKNFIWGGLQRTTDETYPYGIYGIPDWKTNRESSDPGRGGKLHIWRIYDYPHVVLLYYRMYQIAKYHPEIKMYLSRDEYLERAWGTAMALFTIPKEIENWTAYETGLYNELIIEDLIKDLYEEGKKEKADQLRTHWEKKVKFFVTGKPSLFVSEFPFDTTGFESTYAFANYAVRHAKEMGISDGDAARFMEEQMAANVMCRGWLEPAYYLLGSDYRGGGNASYTLSYMSQMGGRSVLSYALYNSPDPLKYLRLGYASFLSSWALMNTGTPESNYGYWFPGPESDGAAGGGFEPSPYGRTWIGPEHHRGSWLYSCEIDLGFNGAVRAAATVLTDDPIFGLFCSGGDYKKVDGAVQVFSKDGIRRRFHVVRAGQRLHMLLDRDHYSSVKPIEVRDDLSEVRFVLETPDSVAHTVKLTISGLPAGDYRVTGEDGAVSTFTARDAGETVVELPVKASAGSAGFTIARTANR